MAKTNTNVILIVLLLLSFFILLKFNIGSIFLGMASIPLISILSFFWLYFDTKDISKIINLSYGIFWLVIPSLGLFLILPELLKTGISFYVSMLIATILTIILYWFMIIIIGWLGMEL